MTRLRRLAPAAAGAALLAALAAGEHVATLAAQRDARPAFDGRPPVAGAAAAVDARPGHRRGRRRRRSRVGAASAVVAHRRREGAEPRGAMLHRGAAGARVRRRSGRYLRGWGGPGAGYEWPEDEHAIHVDHKRNVWITSAGGPRLSRRQGEHDPEVHERRPLPAADRQARPEPGLARHRQREQRRRRLRRAHRQRALRRRRLRQPPRHRLRRRHRRLQADVGRLRQAARRRRVEGGDLRRAAAGAVQPRARHARLARRQGLRRRPAQQPDAGVHPAGVFEREVFIERTDQAARHGLRRGVFARRALSARCISPMPATAACASSIGRRSPRPARSAASAATPASSSSSTRWPWIRRAISTPPRSAPAGGCRSSCQARRVARHSGA